MDGETVGDKNTSITGCSKFDMEQPTRNNQLKLTHQNRNKGD